MENSLTSGSKDEVVQAENMSKGPDEQPVSSPIQITIEQAEEVISLQGPNEQAEENDDTTQELTDQVEESQPQELSELSEENQPQELSEGGEESQLQELSEAGEENQLQELSEAGEESQPQELSELSEENQLQELSEAGEESQLQEQSEPDEEGKSPEISELDEGSKIQDLSEQDNEPQDLKNLPAEPIRIQEQTVSDEQPALPSITYNQLTEGQDKQGSSPVPESKWDATQLEETEDSKTQDLKKIRRISVEIAKEHFQHTTATSPLKMKKKPVSTKNEGCSPVPRSYFHLSKPVVPKVNLPKTSDKAVQCNKMLMRRLPLLRKPSAPKAVIPRAKPPTKDKDTQISPSFETLLRKPQGGKKKKENKTVAKVSSNKVSPSKIHPSTSRKKSNTVSSSNVSRTSMPMKKGKKSNVVYNVHITVYDRGRDINSRYMKETAWEDCVVCSGLSRVSTVFNLLKCGRVHVSKLLFVLHTLKILVTRDEMYEALQLMDMDVFGTLNFSEFLEVVNKTSPFAETEVEVTAHHALCCIAEQEAELLDAFQICIPLGSAHDGKNTLWAFRKIKKDMVSVDDLRLVLANLEVNLCCEAIQQALTCIQINKNKYLNFRDFLLAVRELQRSPAEEAFQTECAILERRPFQDVTGLVSADSRWRRKYQNYFDDEVSVPTSVPTSLYFSGHPCSHKYSDFTELPRKASCQFDQNIWKNVKVDEDYDIVEMKKLQSDIPDQKMPNTASSVEHEEGNSKESDIIEVKKTDVADQESTSAEQDLMEEKKPISDIADQPIPSVDNADGEDKGHDITEEEKS